MARFNLELMLTELWEIGMDECPVRAGYLDKELEARDGQKCDVISRTGYGNEHTALVQWHDGVEEEIPGFGLEN